ncbi:MAG: hypothetical protein J6A04_03910 [Clostridia bacterium]|nr:hypothetical protein [Clostridia bacterium]
MLKSFRIITVFFIILILFMPIFVQATDVNMNLTSDTSIQNTSAENTTAVEQSSTTTQETTTDTLSPSTTNYSSNSPTVSTLNQLPESNLGLNNVINIILIVIGILLVLLGIAIIIRLKH